MTVGVRDDELASLRHRRRRGRRPPTTTFDLGEEQPVDRPLQHVGTIELQPLEIRRRRTTTPPGTSARRAAPRAGRVPAAPNMIAISARSCATTASTSPSSPETRRASGPDATGRDRREADRPELDRPGEQAIGELVEIGGDRHVAVGRDRGRREPMPAPTRSAIAYQTAARALSRYQSSTAGSVAVMARAAAAELSVVSPTAQRFAGRRVERTLPGTTPGDRRAARSVVRTVAVDHLDHVERQSGESLGGEQELFGTLHAYVAASGASVSNVPDAGVGGRRDPDDPPAEPSGSSDHTATDVSRPLRRRPRPTPSA